MQTVLGLVIHRFDIHIKRETGCFDVRGGGRSQGPAEVAHFFFFLLTQHRLRGCGWRWGEEQIVGGQGVQKACGWGADSPSLPTHYMADPSPSSRSSHSSFCPPAYHQNSILATSHTASASTSSSAAVCFHTRIPSLRLRVKNTICNFLLEKHLKDGCHDGRTGAK